MKFKRKFRGYSPKDVDRYISDLESKENALRADQKQRIDELSDENFALRQQVEQYAKQVEQYKIDEKAISKALVESQKLAHELQGNAEKFSELTLSRAKIFYATWNAYSQTLVSSLSDEEVRQFNQLKQKVEKIIDAYDGDNVQILADAVHSQLNNAPQPAAATVADHIYENAVKLDEAEARREEELRRQMHSAEEEIPTPGTMPSEKTMSMFVNPIDKVEKAAEHVIELRELVKPTESLADLCRDLGMEVKVSENDKKY